jgi:hypothetical protein
MPRKAGSGKNSSGSLSGIAATLFPLRDKVAPLDTPEFRKNAGQLIGAARPAQAADAAAEEVATTVGASVLFTAAAADKPAPCARSVQTLAR